MSDIWFLCLDLQNSVFEIIDSKLQNALREYTRSMDTPRARLTLSTQPTPLDGRLQLSLRLEVASTVNPLLPNAECTALRKFVLIPASRCVDYA